MLLQDPVQAAILDALNNYSYGDAIFLSERLYAEVSNTECLHLLATCYYRSGQINQAYMLLEKSSCQTSQCKYLMARCCVDIKKFAEAEKLLAGTILTKIKSHEDIEAEFGSLACYVFALLGYIYSKTERTSKAVLCYRRSLILNPLLWKSYEMLCSLGEIVKPETVFQVPDQNGAVKILPVPDSVTLSEQNAQAVHANIVAAHENLQLLSPRNNCFNETPDNNSQNEPLLQDVRRAPRPKQKTQAQTPDPSQIRKTSVLPVKLFSGSIQASPSFGLLPVEQPHLNVGSSTPSFISPLPTDSQNIEIQAPIKTRPITRRTQMGKSPVLNWSNTIKKMEQESKNAPIRRSSRFSNSNSSAVKENNKSQTPGTLNTKGVNRRSKRTTKSQQELNEINKGELSVDTKYQTSTEIPIADQIVQIQQQSLAGVLSLLTSIGKAFLSFSRYDCRSAIDHFSELPEHQYYTGWVMSRVGQAYYELAEYQRSAKAFEEVRRLEPYHIEGLEIYSTVLWHLNKEVELSLLAQELTSMDRKSAQAWFVTGNCFSLQKEHDVAIKFFQRAIQVEPNFVYAYSLLAFEYMYLEEFDKALTCFRNAIRLDPRHYHAWYGVGMIYYRQEKFNLAEVHYRKALSINPQSSILMCNIGVAQHAQQKTEQALHTLNTAIKSNPKNSLCMFHRAQILFSIDKHKEALEELETLKQIIPRESLVYFLMGKVQKKLGNTHLAMMNFSWANDLDPKGLNNQIKVAVDKRYVTEDDDPLSRLEQDASLDEGASRVVEDVDVAEADDSPNQDGGNIFLMDAPNLQAIESDESL